MAVSALPSGLTQTLQRLLAGRNVRAVAMVSAAWGVQFSCVVLASVMVARYLGPSQFGSINYVTALMTFASTVASFGMSTVVTRELVNGRHPREVILGTAVVTRASTGFVALCVMLAYLHFFERNPVAVALASVAVGTLLLESSLVFDCGMQAQRAFGSSSSAKALLAIGNLAMRGSLVLLGAGLVSFIAVQYAESLLYILVFGWITRAYFKGMPARVDVRLARTLVLHGAPIMLAGIATAIYLRIDQVMIAHYLGTDALGRYSAGVKLAEVASAFPGIVAYVLFPSIIEARKTSEEKAEREAIKLYRLMYVAGLGFSVVVTLIGDWLARLMFGAAYEGAGTVLRVYVWSTVFVFLHIASQAQLLSQAKTTHVIVVRTVVGAVTNILLNLVLIPRMGIVGAAWATVVSYGVALFFFFDRQYSWPPVRSMLRAAGLRL